MAAPLARVDLNALKHNLRRVREAAPGRRVLAVVKADAYGHGAMPVASALSEADGLAVARVEEGIALREAGIKARIVMLGGLNEAGEIPAAVHAGLDTVVHHRSQIDLLRRTLPAVSGGMRCWLKVDSGMHRLGIPADQVQTVLEELRTVPGVVPCALMTHLANADDRKDETTCRQLERFAEVASATDLATSIGNSAAVLGWPQAQGDWVRPGIMLYGASPFVDGNAAEDGLMPVMTLSTRLIAINDFKAGDPVGYGGVWRCPQDMRVGVAAIGYGDGYPRHAPPGTPVLVDGERAAIAGRVSMDTITIDLRSCPRARVGDRVVLWGEGLPVEEVANAAGTISYELFCRLTRRVKFDYRQSPEDGR